MIGSSARHQGAADHGGSMRRRPTISELPARGDRAQQQDRLKVHAKPSPMQFPTPWPNRKNGARRSVAAGAGAPRGPGRSGSGARCAAGHRGVRRLRAEEHPASGREQVTAQSELVELFGVEAAAGSSDRRDQWRSRWRSGFTPSVNGSIRRVALPDLSHLLTSTRKAACWSRSMRVHGLEISLLTRGWCLRSARNLEAMTRQARRRASSQLLVGRPAPVSPAAEAHEDRDEVAFLGPACRPAAPVAGAARSTVGAQALVTRSAAAAAGPAVGDRGAQARNIRADRPGSTRGSDGQALCSCPARPRSIVIRAGVGCGRSVLVRAVSVIDRSSPVEGERLGRPARR